MSVFSRPLIGITLGDPAGVGPEVTVKALSEGYIREWCRPVVLGDMGVVQDAVHRSGLDLPVEPVDRALESASAPGVIPVLPESNLSKEDRVPGTPTPGGAEAAARYIETGAGMGPGRSYPGPGHRPHQQGTTPTGRPPLSGPHRTCWPIWPAG